MMQNKRANNLIEWPADGLEPVPICPVCGVDKRKLLYDQMTDTTFFCAPGTWKMYQCASCNSSYIDPRPNQETIGMAYQQYYTHESATQNIGFFRWIRRMFANGYRNYRFGTKDTPSTRLGVIASFFTPRGRKMIDAAMRHLPKPKQGAKLLDFGCGSGLFLSRARSAGWDVVGIDPDPKAVDIARNLNLEVHVGGIEVLDIIDGKFDVVTLSHVIEHVPNPIQVLSACFKALKRGGFLWIETPNIDAEGNRLFGKNWRGLEPPRHLVLFTLSSLQNTLKKVGFNKLENMPHRYLYPFMFGASTAISKGTDPSLFFKEKISLQSIKKADRCAKINPARREFITIKAWKSK